MRTPDFKVDRVLAELKVSASRRCREKREANREQQEEQ
jgi:hypothetical protein